MSWDPWMRHEFNRLSSKGKSIYLLSENTALELFLAGRTSHFIRFFYTVTKTSTTILLSKNNVRANIPILKYKLVYRNREISSETPSSCFLLNLLLFQTLYLAIWVYHIEKKFQPGYQHDSTLQQSLILMFLRSTGNMYSTYRFYYKNR